jgi:hypothetical protein
MFEYKVGVLIGTLQSLVNLILFLKFRCLQMCRRQYRNGGDSTELLTAGSWVRCRLSMWNFKMDKVALGLDGLSRHFSLSPALHTFTSGCVCERPNLATLQIFCSLIVY